jgi:hypothetical protein
VRSRPAGQDWRRSSETLLTSRTFGVDRYLGVSLTSKYAHNITMHITNFYLTRDGMAELLVLVGQLLQVLGVTND